MTCTARVTKDKVVTICYTLTEPGGVLVDGASTDAPLQYLHGHRNVLVGMEQALEGAAVGQQIEVELPASKAFGERRQVKAFKLPRSSFPAGRDLSRGTQFVMEGPEGQSSPVYVKRVVGSEVQVTRQHPLAGVPLRFACTVQKMRESSDEERVKGRPISEVDGGGCSCC